MSDYKPITGELRKYATVSWDPWPDARDRLYQMCDRIDAIHAGLERENAELRRQLDSLMYESRPMTDENMAAEGFVRLPKDADGDYIHVGDKLIDEDDKLQKPAIVKCILYNDEGCVVSDIDPRGCWYDPSLLRHYHAPTVEDVLREFAYGLGVPVADSYVAATAAKLRLAGDAE